jgi:hypothetical protein
LVGLSSTINEPDPQTDAPPNNTPEGNWQEGIMPEAAATVSDPEAEAAGPTQAAQQPDARNFALKAIAAMVGSIAIGTGLGLGAFFIGKEVVWNEYARNAAPPNATHRQWLANHSLTERQWQESWNSDLTGKEGTTGVISMSTTLLLLAVVGCVFLLFRNKLRCSSQS